MLGPEGPDVEAGGEVEEADGAVGEAAGEVEVGQSEAATRQTVGVVHVRGVEIEIEVGVSTRSEILGRSVAIDVLVSPRGVQEVSPAPNSSSETVPEKIRT